jgi:hypothetical protein
MPVDLSGGMRRPSWRAPSSSAEVILMTADDGTDRTAIESTTDRQFRQTGIPDRGRMTSVCVPRGGSIAFLGKAPEWIGSMEEARRSNHGASNSDGVQRGGGAAHRKRGRTTDERRNET